MRELLLPRLAVRGLYGNRKLYFPFLLATSFMALVFYLVAAFSYSDSLGQNIPDGDNIRLLMRVGFTLLPVVILPFLLYVNSYLMKARSRELALYAVLGLERRHIAGVLLIESAICFLLCVLLATGAGALLCPLVFDGLLAAIGIRVDMAWSFSAAPVWATVKVFGVCFAALLFANVIRAVRTRPASLLHGDQQGEKPLRARPLVALGGLLCLGGGYWLSATCTLQSFSMLRFMLAILLVIPGTYGVIAAGSVEVLRRMRQSPRFYMDPSRFIVVSGLLHRMRKNAAGLTNLCLFGTAALFTLVCSFCVLLGQGDVISMLGQALADGQIGLNTAELTTDTIVTEFTTLSFLGIFFVLVFLAFTILILYYKQLAESMEDEGRFRILRAVGLSDEMTARTAKKQLRTVFFLPLIGALIHIAFAFPLLSVLLSALAISDIAVLLAGTGLAALVFAAVYALCYRITSNAYLRNIA